MMVFKNSEIIDAKEELQRMHSNSTMGEIWLAYLHLVNAKHKVKSPELFRILDSASRSALEALREAEVDKSRSQSIA